jgi:predicted site-specific integrase-resolvase
MEKGTKNRMDEVLLSREELAKRWNCCKETIKRMQRRGDLSAIIFSGKNIRYLLSDIEKVEQERRHRAFGMAERNGRG